MNSAEAEGDWLLEITFPRPYTGADTAILADGTLMIQIPFMHEQSAQTARSEMQVAVRPRFRVVRGEVLKGETEQ